MDRGAWQATYSPGSLKSARSGLATKQYVLLNMVDTQYTFFKCMKVFLIKTVECMIFFGNMLRRGKKCPGRDEIELF